MENDLERMLFFEHARKDAEASYAKNPLDAENLTRLGGALLELSQFQVGDGSLKMVEDAVSKLEEALRIGPKRPETLWCLGNAQTSRGLYTMDQETALIFFSKASECFEQAMNEDPGNEMYRKSYELSFKVPEMHSEVQRQLQSQQAVAAGPSASKVKVSKKKDNDLIYDVFGWVILAVSVVVWVGMAKSNVPPPPPRSAARTSEDRNPAKRANTTGSGSSWQEGSSASLSEKTLQSMTVERLRALLKERGLSTKGKKDELIARLK